MQLREHGVVGDGARAALIDANATVNWFCPTGIDQPPALWSLVDAPNGARIRVGPVGGRSIDQVGTQRADTDAPILVTTLHGPDGSVEIHDHLANDRIVRVAYGLRGEVDVGLTFVPGDAFGPARKVHRWSEGLAFGQLIIRGLGDWGGPGGPEGAASAVRRLRAGERVVVTIAHAPANRVTSSAPAAAPLTVGEALAEQEELQRRWRRALGALECQGPYASAARSSAMMLTLLTHESGALLRALTTSLPARTGNERSVDERYAWLRDNAWAVEIWSRLGAFDRAGSTRAWLRDRTGDELPLATAYTTSGDRPPGETDLHPPGWEGNGPVRIGSRAGAAFDLGAIAAASLVLDDRDAWPRLETIGDFLAEHWRKPDVGRWSDRGPRHRHIESALLVRFALRALIDTTRRRNPLDPVTQSWTVAKDAINEWLPKEAISGTRPAAVWRRIGGDAQDDSSDAALLWHLGAEGPALAEDTEFEARSRQHATLEQALAQLGEGPFLHRHLPHVDDGFPPGQGADLAASFMAVTALARANRWDEAHQRMETLLATLGPTRIGATHVDPFTGDLRGNLVAAPTHLAVIDAALALSHGPR